MLDLAQIKQLIAVRIGYEMEHIKDLEELTESGHLTVKQYEAVKQMSIFVLRGFEDRLIEKLAKEKK